MSSKELVIRGTTGLVEFKYGTITNKFGIRIIDDINDAVIVLDRSQAHMLYLYLQEHLGKNF